MQYYHKPQIVIVPRFEIKSPFNQIIDHAVIELNHDYFRRVHFSQSSFTLIRAQHKKKQQDSLKKGTTYPSIVISTPTGACDGTTPVTEWINSGIEIDR